MALNVFQDLDEIHFNFMKMNCGFVVLRFLWSFIEFLYQQ